MVAPAAASASAVVGSEPERESASETDEATAVLRSSGRSLAIAFARSSSPTFPIVWRRLDALATLGRLTVTPDDKGREAWFELTIESALVENARRIANLLAIVRARKTTEVSLDGDLLGRHDLDGFLERLETVRRCWLRHRQLSPQSCRTACPVGCAALPIWPSYEFLSYSGSPDPPWYAVGTFDGRQVTVDKEAMRRHGGTGGRGAAPAMVLSKTTAPPEFWCAECPVAMRIFAGGFPAWIIG